MNSSSEQASKGVFTKRRVIAAALLLMALTLSCSLATRFVSKVIPITGAEAAPRGLIAYVGTDGNIYTVNRDGKQVTALTQDANLNPGTGQVQRVYQYPTWAPDGRQLAFMGFSRSQQSGARADLYTIGSDGKMRANAFNSQETFPFYLFWSPNSQYVTFLSDVPGGNDLALYLAAAAGGDSRIVGTGNPFYWDWSPDNQTIIVHTGGASSQNMDASMALVQIGSSVQKKELALKPGIFQAPAWSPKGDEMLLTVENSTGVEQLILAARDGSLKRVLAQISGPVAFAWSPQGTRLAYTTQVEGDTSGLEKHLVVLDPNQAQQAAEITHGIVMAYFWSPDGKKLAYFSVSLPSPGASLQNVAQTSPTINLQVQVYDLASGETKQVAAFAPTAAMVQVLPFFDQYQRSGTIWSPDSKDLVLASVDKNGNPSIFVVSADGALSHKIADGDLAFWSWK